MADRVRGARRRGPGPALVLALAGLAAALAWTLASLLAWSTATKVAIAVVVALVGAAKALHDHRSARERPKRTSSGSTTPRRPPGSLRRSGCETH